MCKVDHISFLVHSIGILFDQLAQFTVEFDVDLKIQITDITDVWLDREGSDNLFVLLHLKIFIVSTSEIISS